MKIKLLIMLFILTQVVNSQNYQTVEEINDHCAALSFSSDEEAQIAVDNILDKIGLFRNFIIQECPDINNAVAKNIINSSGVKERYILYDNKFFNKIETKAGNKWASTSILAHEIGHHLNGHALNNKGSKPSWELEADYFSGMVLAKMGATLTEAQSAIQTLRYEKATSTHPAKVDRLNEIERAWNKIIGNSNELTKEEKEVIKAFELYRKGELAFEKYDFTAAVSYFKQSKEIGNIDAYYYLSHIYYAGLGVDVNFDIAYQYARKGYDLGSVPATYQLGKYYAIGVGVAIDKKASERFFKKDFQIKWFKEQYKKYKIPFHAYTVGYMYREGFGGVRKDYENAIFWYKAATQKGDLVAQNNLAFLYQDGKNNDDDLKMSIELYRQAAENNYPTAQVGLGWMYYDGKGVPQDYKKAMYWMEKATESEYPQAYLNLANMYYQGIGIDKDIKKAFEMYEVPAEFGLVQAQHNLASIYIIEEKYDKALYWYKKAANKNFAESQFNLGILYHDGLGTSKDIDKALYWIRKAARQGLKQAQVALKQLGETW